MDDGVSGTLLIADHRIRGEGEGRLALRRLRAGHHRPRYRCTEQDHRQPHPVFLLKSLPAKARTPRPPLGDRACSFGYNNTTILPPAWFSSMQRCASTISSKRKVLPT